MTCRRQVKGGERVGQDADVAITHAIPLVQIRERGPGFGDKSRSSPYGTSTFETIRSTIQAARKHMRLGDSRSSHRSLSISAQVPRSKSKAIQSFYPLDCRSGRIHLLVDVLRWPVKYGKANAPEHGPSKDKVP